VQKTSRSPTRNTQGFSQSATKDSLRRNENVSVPQFFEDEVNFFDDTSPSHSAHSGANYSSAQRMNSNPPMPQFDFAEEFFPSQDFTGNPQYSSSSRRSSNGHAPMSQYEFGDTSSSKSGHSSHRNRTYEVPAMRPKERRMPFINHPRLIR